MIYAVYTYMYAVHIACACVYVSIYVYKLYGVNALTASVVGFRLHMLFMFGLVRTWGP